MATLFRDFADLCKKLEKTSSILHKRELIARFLMKLEKDEWKPFVLLLTGKILPEAEGKSLYIGYSTIKKAIEMKVSTLVPLPQPSILEVYQVFIEISSISGADSTRRRIEALASLFNRLSEEEKNYLIRSLFGEMRIGAVEGIVIQALADASGNSYDDLRKAYLLLGDIGYIAETLAYNKLDIKNLKPIIFNPIRTMLATPADSIEEAYELAKGPVAVEVKYDGVRVQIHYKNGVIRIFSRRLTDITRFLPEVIAEINASFKVNSVSEAIIEGEVIAVDAEEKPLPFQILMRRFRRIKDFDKVAANIPIKLYLFDILYLNGELLIDMPYRDRYEILRDTVNKELLAERIVADDIHQAKEFYEEAIEKGHEGAIIKKLDSPYILGVRGSHWIKVKEIATIDTVIVGAEWGHGRRRNWLSDYYLAVYSAAIDEFMIVGKTYKGLTDEEFEWITKKLLELKIADEGYRIWVKPEIVVEVAFNDIQKSPKYESGIALRFARITRFRPDKDPKDITTIEELKRLYLKSFRDII
jgi:DNA ligase-1